MRIQERERRDDGTERIELVPESLDDLWHLQHVLEPGDRVAGETTRRIKRDDDRLRDTGGEREHLWVTLAVDSVEFHKFANRLRIGGVIVECSREDELGQHHTLNVEERKSITVTKRFKPDQIQRLEEAVAATQNPDVAVVTVEEGQAHIHTIAQYGTESYASISASTGKGEYARDRSELFGEIYDRLRRLEVDAIVLAGPGFTKQDVLDYIERTDPELAESITTVDTSAVGDRGVHEVLKRGAVADIQDRTRIQREAELIDELMSGIATDEPVTYGAEPVERAAEYGAVDHLLVLDEWLRSARTSKRSRPEQTDGTADEGDGDDDASLSPAGDEEDGTQITDAPTDDDPEADDRPPVDVDAILESVDQQGGDVTVFSSEFDPGQQLRNLGGIAAILRYPIQ